MVQRYITYILILSGLFMGSSAWALDLTGAFHKALNKHQTLTPNELAALGDYDFYLVPGILSEAFVDGDERSAVTFSRLTGEYFETQQNLLKNQYGLRSQRLSSSSKSVAEIRANIRKALTESRAAERKVIFMTHSLGGLALLEELVSFPGHQATVAGIVFLQSPFKGSPIADVYFEGPLHLNKWLRPIIPYFNTSTETIKYLGTSSRKQFMAESHLIIQSLVQHIPIITVGGVVNGHSSLFTPAVSIMATGCFQKVFGQCVIRTSFAGPYDSSDGMVPFESSKIEGTDFIKLEGVDHGETVVNIPFEQYDKSQVTTALIRTLLSKMNGN
ncbi:hypothetical protein EZJ49_05270 [Bdellovibrio bacteriovorus]|uniref:hypothetical protein n=1 Tax=Bdellovibrio bacteriovorus TaxID=959 RepID=UPI0021D2CD4D|nr:hypothetical protein [Bdellovibrio bacteriovorus]UXR65658.1 hypothetical protein EZJ49_05270 [Bdellovibrio bacteriovorus]